VYFAGTSNSRAEVRTQSEVSTEKIKRPVSLIQPASRVSEVLAPIIVDAANPQQQLSEKTAIAAEPPANNVSRSENESFTLPNRLDFPFHTRPRNGFAPPTRVVRHPPNEWANSGGEQQWARQKAQADLHRQMIFNLLSDLNKEVKPEVSTTCQLLPQITCSVSESPALAVLRRYAGFFAGSGIRDNLVLSYRDGVWSVDMKAAQ
jgi:hypothetical protein